MNYILDDLKIFEGSQSALGLTFSHFEEPHASSAALTTKSESTSPIAPKPPFRLDRKPQLSPYPPLVPELYFCRILEELNKINDSMVEFTDFTVARLTQMKSDLEQCTRELSERLKKNSLLMKEANFWGTLQKIASSLAAAFSIMVGTALIASGGGAMVGGMMLASGILSITNMILTETKTWEKIAEELAGDDQQKKEKITFYLPTALSLVTAGLGLASGGHLLHIPRALELASRNALPAVAGCLQVLGGSLQMKNSVAHYQLNTSQADLLGARETTKLTQIQYSQTLTSTEGGRQDEENLHDTIEKLIRGAHQTAQAMNNSIRV